MPCSCYQFVNLTIVILFLFAIAAVIIIILINIITITGITNETTFMLLCYGKDQHQEHFDKCHFHDVRCETSKSLVIGMGNYRVVQTHFVVNKKIAAE